MIVEFKLPQYGMGMTEGTIVEWLKAEGEHVTADEVIGSVEAAKATSELVAPVGGTLIRILVTPEETVPVGTVIALIEAN